MRIVIASDHAGYPLKEEVIRFLREKDYDLVDLGVYEPAAIDYPDQAEKLAKAVAQGEAEQGIIICGTGIGVSIAANKVRGIRCALCHDVFSATMARQHNDCNVLALGARVVGSGHALAIVEAYLGARFLGGRHQTRVEKIGRLEE